MRYRLAPSMLSGDFSKLGDQIHQLAEAGATDLHFDVMDGVFVPNLSFGIPVLKSLRPVTDLFLDAHLMITDPKRYVEAFAEAGADLISFHVEACEDIHDTQVTIKAIQNTGKKVGLAINPETELEFIYPFLDQIDMALVMGVHPGFGGQGMIEETLDKVHAIREIIEKEDLSCDLEFDGGVKLDNVERVIAAGANVIVAGSAVFSGDVYANTEAFMVKLREAVL